MRGIALAAALAALTLPASAGAATLVNHGGKLVYTATSGAPVEVSFSYGQLGRVTVIPQSSGNRDPVQASGCTTSAETFVVFYCEGVTEVVATGGPGDDRFNAGSLVVPFTADGGDGNDQLVGGDGRDTFRGGAGDDYLYGETGDSVSGGPGIDWVTYTVPGNDRFTSDGISLAQVGPVSITLDGIADDGLTGDGANFHADIENVESDGRWDHPNRPQPTYGPVTLAGTDGPNHLLGASGPDTITGGGGFDVLEGKGGDDRLFVRDGFPDRVHCGAGTDIAEVDPLDIVSDTCEHVRVEGATAPGDDAPPLLAWRSGLGVDASDDRGLASVQWFIDDRLLCTVSAPPFDCAYTPDPRDVGTNTILVLATDSAGQTTSLVTSRTVARFTPTAVTLRVRGRVANGKVTLPAGVPCRGTVTIGLRTAALRRDCTYRMTVKRAKTYVARYLGTEVVAPRRSKPVRART